MDNATEQIFIVAPASNAACVQSQKLVEVPPNAPANLDNVEDLSNVCRVCAAVTEFLIPIFHGEGLQHSLADKIHQHLPIQVTEHDALPRALCYQCTHTLLAWHELAACCAQADRALRARLPPATHCTEQKPAANEECQSLKNKEDEFKPCRSNETQPADETTERLEIRELDTGPSLNLDDYDEVTDEEDKPLSVIASRKTADLYNNFYNALLNFRNHFATDHRSEDNSPDISDSSDSEAVSDDKKPNIDDIDRYDDLSNMKRNTLDEETRVELNEVRAKINGKVCYMCKICGKHLSSPYTYIFHKRTHTGERPCVCHRCGKQFTSPSGLHRHLTETHDKIRRHACRFCPKSFMNIGTFNAHMRIHTGEKPFVCPHCGKRFTQSSTLRVHLKTHSEQFPFHCAECGAKFRLKSGLSRHQLKHSGERPHVCGDCGKSFRQKHELNTHTLSHTDSKPFACLVCGATFRQRRALRHHTKRLHETDQDVASNVPRESNLVVFSQLGQYQFGAYPAPPPYEEPRTRTCDYCQSRLQEAAYKQHLFDDHTELLFHCEECDAYVDKKDFIPHMSVHAVEYATNQEKETKKVKKVKKKKEASRDEKIDFNVDESENVKTVEDISATREPQVIESLLQLDIDKAQDKLEDKIEIEIYVSPEKTANINVIEHENNKSVENEFSDHSDTDFDFGPLPESVFEAIEDSEDSEPLENIETTPPITETSDNATNHVNNTSDITEPVENKQKKHKRPRTCPICAKVYNASSSYFYHMKYFHKQSKEHECSVCKRRFGTKGSLSQHETIHTGECPFECKECGKKFRAKASLYIHEQTHKGIKTYSCNQCQISFRWRTHLKRHIKRHSAEKSHVCSICGRGFSIRCDLLRHAKTHSAGKFACDKCGVKCAQLRYLKVHMDKKHSASVAADQSPNVPSA